MMDTSDAPPTFSLHDLADEKVGSGKEREVESNIKLREKVAKNLLILFISTNSAVVVAIGALACVDRSVSGEIVRRATTQPSAFEKLLASLDVMERSRVVNSNVLMTLIGATTVQVGAGVLTMTQYLFPRRGT